MTKQKSERFDLQRRAVSHITSTSWRTVPHVSYIYEPDITDFYAEYKTLPGDKGKISFNTIMLKVIVEGLLAAPKLNAHISYHYIKSEGSLCVKEEINLSIPWLLKDGRMITPTVRGAEKMSVAALSLEMAQLSEKIEKTNIDEMFYKAAVSDTKSGLKKMNPAMLRRILAAKIGLHSIRGLRGKAKIDYYKIPETARLTEKDLVAGTVTVSNIGSLYKELKGFFGLLEIVPPQVFAVGLGSVQEKPGVYVDENGSRNIGIRKTLPMCLAFDHRAFDFNAVIPFMKRLDAIFEQPGVIHSW